MKQDAGPLTDLIRSWPGPEGLIPKVTDALRSPPSSAQIAR